MLGMVMDDGERLDAGPARKLGPLLPGRMTPAPAGRVYGLREHAVVDHEVGVLDEAGEVRGRPGVGMLDVADVADAPTQMVEAITGRAARMVQRMGGDRASALEAEVFARLEAMVLEARGQLVEPDREQRRGVEAVEGRLGASPAEVAAPGPNDALAQRRGLEERQAADVVEMEVAQEDVDFVRRRFAQGRAQGRQAGS